jgi:hypothetical protein
MDTPPMKENEALGSPFLKSMAFHEIPCTKGQQIWRLHFFHHLRNDTPIT